MGSIGFWLAFFVFCFLVAMYAEKLHRSGIAYFIASIFFSPLIVFLYLLIAGDAQKTGDNKNNGNTFNDKNVSIPISSEDEWEKLKFDIRKLFPSLDSIEVDDQFRFIATDGNAKIVANRQRDLAKILFYSIDSTPLLEKYKINKSSSTQKGTSEKETIEALEKLSNLYEKGVLTEEEFNNKKEKLLSRI
ncbi:SHOCT domain-containing protein [Hydrogenimonas urashimensis]|uniref:SHOCT domain-containing protein n=1 Tax=Hydrogenimonas urashimensis TaxID=2740515 RepID=UPI001916170C|nr:SHOCT domain-containing protein [Hydrogenimonas urashimensis]